MPSVYLSSADAIAYGVPSATTIQIVEASNLVDSYLKRPAGLMYMPDYQNSPCFMAALSPTFSFALTGPIAPGSNVVIPFPQAGFMSTVGLVGSVVVFERATPGNCEACVITANTKTSITLASVALSHIATATMDFGVVINEQKALPSKRAIVRLGQWPIGRIISGLGSYRYGRRNDQQAGLYDDRNLLSIMQTFGGPPAWQAFDVTASDYNPMTSEVWIPSGIQMAYYSDVRIYYVAGYTQANIPSIVKQVTAQIITAKLNTSGLQGGLKEARAGDTALTRFANSVLDDDSRAQLDTYRARLYV